jgi:hypothetical protein
MLFGDYSRGGNNMDKKDLIKFLHEMLKPRGFVKRGNYWYSENNDLRKVINLQRSRFSNRYYINYGYVLKKLELEGLTMHIFNGLGSLDEEENQRIKELLDVENKINDDQRKQELKLYIEKYILNELSVTNSEQDILNALSKRPHLNDIPLTVKKYLGLL